MPRVTAYYGKLVRKSSDGQGVVMWWYSNGWRIVRSPEQPHTYRVETSDHFKPYYTRGTYNTLKDAKNWVKIPNIVPTLNP